MEARAIIKIQSIVQPKGSTYQIYEVVLNDKPFTTFMFDDNKYQDENTLMNEISKVAIAAIREQIMKNHPNYFQAMTLNEFSKNLRELKYVTELIVS